MILSMSSQVKLFASTVAMGIGAGLIYDFIRLSRRIVKHSVLLCNIEDGIYWLFISVVVFYFMLNNNYGEIRLFSVMGAFTGMVLYFLTVSFAVLKALVAIADFIGKVIALSVKIITAPFRALFRLLKIPFDFVKFFVKKQSLQGKKLLQKTGSYAKIRSRKFQRDLKVIFKKI